MSNNIHPTTYFGPYQLFEHSTKDTGSHSEILATNDFGKVKR